MADMFNIPLIAVSMLYIQHSLEPNGGRERQALQELIRGLSVLLSLWNLFSNSPSPCRTNETSWLCTQLEATAEQFG